MINNNTNTNNHNTNNNHIINFDGLKVKYGG